MSKLKHLNKRTIILLIIIAIFLPLAIIGEITDDEDSNSGSLIDRIVPPSSEAKSVIYAETTGTDKQVVVFDCKENVLGVALLDDEDSLGLFTVKPNEIKGPTKRYEKLDYLINRKSEFICNIVKPSDKKIYINGEQINQIPFKYKYGDKEYQYYLWYYEYPRGEKLSFSIK